MLFRSSSGDDSLGPTRLRAMLSFRCCTLTYPRHVWMTRRPQAVIGSGCAESPSRHPHYQAPADAMKDLSRLLHLFDPVFSEDGARSLHKRVHKARSQHIRWPPSVADANRTLFSVPSVLPFHAGACANRTRAFAASPILKVSSPACWGRCWSGTTMSSLCR